MNIYGTTLFFPFFPDRETGYGYDDTLFSSPFFRQKKIYEARDGGHYLLVTQRSKNILVKRRLKRRMQTIYTVLVLPDFVDIEESGSIKRGKEEDLKTSRKRGETGK